MCFVQTFSKQHKRVVGSNSRATYGDVDRYMLCVKEAQAEIKQIKETRYVFVLLLYGFKMMMFVSYQKDLNLYISTTNAARNAA